jgi:hypothetical protein
MQRSLLLALADDPILQTDKARKSMKKLLQLIEKLEEGEKRRIREKFKKIKAYEKKFRRLFEAG